MQNADHVYSPADVERMLGISTAVQRDRRRRRGGDAYFGKRMPSGKWKFAYSDIIGLAVTEIVLPRVNDLFEAERIGFWCAPLVAARLQLPEPYPMPPGALTEVEANPRFAFFASNQNPIITSEAWQLDYLDAAIVTAIDIQRLSAEVAASVGEHLGELGGKIADA